MFTYTALGSGYFSVLVDGVAVSKHTAEREALENANRAKLASPLAVVRVKHDYEVDVALTETPAETDAVVGTPVTVGVVADDPTAVSVSGSLTVTPLKDVDVVLRLNFVP